MKNKAVYKSAQSRKIVLILWKLPGIAVVFLNQFKSPLIYVLVAAAVLSVAIKEWSDAGFITAVLIINAVIGCIQEYSARRGIFKRW